MEVNTSSLRSSAYCPVWISIAIQRGFGDCERILALSFLRIWAGAVTGTDLYTMRMKYWIGLSQGQHFLLSSLSLPAFSTPPNTVQKMTFNFFVPWKTRNGVYRLNPLKNFNIYKIFKNLKLKKVYTEFKKSFSSSSLHLLTS